MPIGGMQGVSGSGAEGSLRRSTSCGGTAIKSI